MLDPNLDRMLAYVLIVCFGEIVIGFLIGAVLWTFTAPRQGAAAPMWRRVRAWRRAAAARRARRSRPPAGYVSIAWLRAYWRGSIAPDLATGDGSAAVIDPIDSRA